MALPSPAAGKNLSRNAMLTWAGSEEWPGRYKRQQAALCHGTTAA